MLFGNKGDQPAAERDSHVFVRAARASGLFPVARGPQGIALTGDASAGESERQKMS